MSKSKKDNFYKKHILPFKEFLEAEAKRTLEVKGAKEDLCITDEELNILKKLKNRTDDNYFKITLEDLDKAFDLEDINTRDELPNINDQDTLPHAIVSKKIIAASVAKSIITTFSTKYFKSLNLKQLKEIVQDNTWLSKRLVNKSRDKILVNPAKKELSIVDQDKKTLYSTYAKTLVRYFIEDPHDDIYYSSQYICNKNEFDKINNIFEKHSEGLIAYLFLKNQLFVDTKRFLYSTDYRVADKALEFISIPQAINILKESPELYSVICKKIDRFSYEPGPITKEEMNIIKNIQMPGGSGRKVFHAIPKRNRNKFLLDLSYKYLELYKEYKEYDLWTYKRDCIEAAENIINFFLCKINKKHMHMFMFLASIPGFQNVIRDKVNV